MMSRSLVSAAVVLAALVLPRATGFAVARRGVRMSAAVDSGAALPKSFVQTEMRNAAMKLHTRQQAPKEGEKEAPVQTGPPPQPTVVDYGQFMLDSKIVYEAFEKVVNTHDALAVFRDTGLERSKPLEQSLETLAKDFDASVADLTPGEFGPAYVALLEELDAEMTASGSAGESVALGRFMCHFYNHYFAHTAGGRMIGKKLSKALIDGRELDFYKWNGDVKELLTSVRIDIDEMAAAWSEEQRQACLEETGATFKYSGSLMRYFSMGSGSGGGGGHA